VRRQSAALPEHLAAGQVVAAHAIGARHDNLRFAGVFNDNWTRPRCIFGSGDAPALLAGALVEGEEKRLLFVVPVDDERVAEKGGRTAFAMAVLGVHFAEVFFPDQLAAEIEAKKTIGAEE